VIVCAAPSPAIDKLFEIGELRPGRIHRPESFVAVPGGKGLNVARAAATLGAEVHAVCLLSGHAGRWVADALAAEGVRASAVWGPGETRSVLSVADRRTAGLTEFYERAPALGEATWAAFEAAVGEALEGPGWLALSGSLPPGAPADAYARLAAVGRSRGVRVALDATGEALAAGLAGAPDLVKVNVAEAGEVVGGRPDADPLATGPSGPQGEALAAGLRERTGEDAVAVVTLGEAGAVLAPPGGEGWRGRVPAVGRYPVGSGDALLAGLLAGRERGLGWRAALAVGLGAGAANAERTGQGRLDPERARALADAAELTAT
jgi:1-phosphofructokinase family hexose kinase